MSRAEFDQFIREWDQLYKDDIATIPLFDKKVTGAWSRQRQGYLAGVLYHVRCHFGEVLWEMGNVAPPEFRPIIVANIKDELGVGQENHEHLYQRLANRVGCDLKFEKFDKKYYLPFLQFYNEAQMRAIHEFPWDEVLLGFGVGEHLDYMDYSNMQSIFQSFGVEGDDLAFFQTHLIADHFDGPLAKYVLDAWENNQPLVRDAFDRVRHFQIMMWRELSRACSEFGSEAPTAAFEMKVAQTSSELIDQGTDGLRRPLQYDLAAYPRMPSKFADISALDQGDETQVELVFDATTKAMLASMKDRKDWGGSSLVFGGTGFIGCHLTHRLLQDRRVRRVYAIVRPRKGMSARDRILNEWRKYDLPADVVDLSKFEVLEGSIAAHHFGLEEQDYQRLAADVDSVFQSAGDTDYLPSYAELRQEWVLGLLGIVQFCFAQRAKQLTYIGSTIAHLYRDPEDFNRKDSWWYSGYAQMKWANQAIIHGLQRQGMRAQVCEAPYVLGSTSVGKDPGSHYTFWRVMTMGKMFRYTYDGDFPDVAPVDYLVDATVQNALSQSPIPTVRPCYPQRLTTTELAPLLGCKVLAWEALYKELEKYATPAQLRLIPKDMLKLIEKSNLDPIYPPGYDLSGLPPALELARFYLQRQNLL
jgi:nucleoside-diphosphate-sugar epimerase